MFTTRHLEEKIFLSIVAAVRMADIKGGKYYSRDCRDKADSNFFCLEEPPEIQRKVVCHMPDL